MKLKIFRYDGESESPEGSQTRYDTFEFDAPPGMTVLSGLFHIQERFDDSLSFRYSCRGAVCGSCAMLINKVPTLACRTQLQDLIQDEEGRTTGETISLKPYDAISSGESWDPTSEILIEPLPHFPVLKDLIVNMDRFFEFYRSVIPVLKADDSTLPADATERTMEPAMVTELEHYTNCILCASCYGACPVSGEAPDFIGPAALAKLYRFTIDPREEDETYRLELGDSKAGWWGCEFHGNCKRVCPKGVPPNLGIGKARQKLMKMGKTPPE
jgi:succinate dehydrogenase / fumarate reductase, iron-sulfur subunit